MASSGLAAGFVTSRVSVSSDGEQSNHGSYTASISADGRYVAFQSQATNLIPNSPPHTLHHIYVHDQETGQTERVSVSTGGVLGNSSSVRPVISADGRVVAFYSAATNLVPNDTNGTWDIFTHDRGTGETTRVSVSSTGEQANDTSDWFQNTLGISADGRFVTFTSRATNLVEAELSTRPDVFVHDRETGETTHVSVASDGTPGNWDSRSGGISADGRYVVFWSEASNLVPNDTNGRSDVFVHDRETGQTTRVSLTDAGGQINHSSRTPAISADGSTVAFWSFAWNVVEGLPPLTHTWRVYAHDRPTGSTTLVTRRYDGTPGSDGTVIPPSLSVDGRYVAFTSSTPNLVEDGPSGLRHAYVRDIHAGITTLASVNADGEPGNASSVIDPNVGNGLSISGDGRFVAFDSFASNLVPNDTNGTWDIFVFDRLAQVNVAPSIGSDEETIIVDEGQTATNSGTYSDEDDGDDVIISASIGTVTKTGTNSGSWNWEFQTIDGPADSQTVTITADDGQGGSSQTTFDLVVENVAPTVGEIMAPVELVPTNTEITAGATFTDPGVLDTHTAEWDWGDGHTSAGTVIQEAGFGSVEDSHTYTEPGLYTITLTVTDNDGDWGVSIYEYVLVSDPNPTERDDCMNGGWEDYGFRNQGLCVQFVNTGQDSR
jgi:Tol biopolymer transport system component